MVSQVDPAQLQEVTCETVRIDPPPVAPVVRRLASPRVVWAGPAEQAVVGSGAAVVVHAAGADRFTEVQSQLTPVWDALAFDGEPAARPRALGGFGFLPDASSAPEWQAFPPAQLVIPQLQVSWEAETAWVTQTRVDDHAAVSDLRAVAAAIEAIGAEDTGAAPRIIAQTRTPERRSWEGAVGQLLAQIDAGTLEKLVLAQRLRTELDASPDGAGVLQRLTDRYPRCYRFLIEPVPGSCVGGLGAPTRRPPRLMGASPERLIAHRDGTVETDALAGTTARGDTAALDEWLATELLADAKNSVEHEVVVETLSARLAPFLRSVSVDDRRIRRLDTVQHLWTPISGEAAPATTVLDVVAALHPTPAVGGIPPARAQREIRRAEPFDRGWYAGPVGWVDAAGEGTFAVAIRSAAVEGAIAHCYAGVGLVASSDPAMEWEETQLKFRPMLEALDPAGVSRW
jgi:menaquinone-specific isochorismate synthase